jgi:Flp pilus assembly protein TadD
MGDEDDELEQLREAVRLEPDFAEANADLAAALAKSGRLSEAAYHYRRALRSRPDLQEARRGLDAVLAAQASRSDRKS